MAVSMNAGQHASSRQRKQVGCDTERASSHESTVPSSRPFKILAVDDSAISRKLVDQSLSGEGCALMFAKNSREALDVFAKHQPALVIKDWNMSDMEGPELCKRIRRDFPDRYSYLILLTSNSGKDKIVEGLRAGADDYLTKPFHSDGDLPRAASFL